MALSQHDDPVTLPTSFSVVGELAVRLHSTVKSIILPGLMLQSFALTIVAFWYLVPSTRGVFNFVAQTREVGGLLFSALVFAIAGGVIPLVVQAAQGRRDWRSVVPDASFLAWGWMLLGLATDLLYRTQTTLFGNSTDTMTLMQKTAFDQFAWTPFIVVPYFRILYGLMEREYRFAVELLPMSSQWFRDASLNLVANWLVWIPTVFLIYALPLPLQIPFAAVMVCFYSLLLLSLSPAKTESSTVNMACIAVAHSNSEVSK